jgi:hypothetical protein
MRGLLAATTLVAGQPASGQKMFMGAGTVSCGEWLKARSIQPPNNRDLATQYHMQAWIDGFLSGANLSNAGPDILSSKPKSVAMYSFVDNYCRSNSLDTLADAAVALAQELGSRAER